MSSLLPPLSVLAQNRPRGSPTCIYPTPLKRLKLAVRMQSKNRYLCSDTCEWSSHLPPASSVCGPPPKAPVQTVPGAAASLNYVQTALPYGDSQKEGQACAEGEGRVKHRGIIMSDNLLPWRNPFNPRPPPPRVNTRSWEWWNSEGQECCYIWHRLKGKSSQLPQRPQTNTRVTRTPSLARTKIPPRYRFKQLEEGRS